MAVTNVRMWQTIYKHPRLGDKVDSVKLRENGRWHLNHTVRPTSDILKKKCMIKWIH